MLLLFSQSPPSGILNCRLGFPKLESPTAAYCVYEDTTKINICSIYNPNRYTVTNVSQRFVIKFVAQAIGMKHLSMLTMLTIYLIFILADEYLCAKRWYFSY